jgi:glyoxalase family protein
VPRIIGQSGVGALDALGEGGLFLCATVGDVKLDGIHHITAITENGQRNVDFYAGVMGLRLVKKTVNQDNPTVYHLFYADEKGDPGSDLTFFEYPGVPEGRAGAGMIHQIVWRVGSEDAISFWEERLAAHGTESENRDGRLHFSDPEGLGHELVVVEVPDEPLIAEHPEVPSELALQGFHAARAYSNAPDASRELLEQTLGFAPLDASGFAPSGNGWEARGENRGGLWAYDQPPDQPGLQGAGSVHHIAWASKVEDHEAWRQRVIEGGATPTPVIDRFYFRSIYFREPSGVLFEIATLGPGFTVDEPLEHLGEKLSLPPAFEHLRPEVEPRLRPITNPRHAAAR